MTDEAEIGPWGRRRDLYFLRKHERGVARQARLHDEADLAIRELAEVDRERQVAELAIGQVPFGGARWHRIVSHDEALRARSDDLRNRARERRRAAAPTHAERLDEWSVNYDHLPPPSPGELLLARASKKPYRDRGSGR